MHREDDLNRCERHALPINAICIEAALCKLACPLCLLRPDQLQPLALFCKESLEYFQQWSRKMTTAIDAGCWAMVNSRSLSPGVRLSSALQNALAEISEEDLLPPILKCFEDFILMLQANLTFVNQQKRLSEMANPLLLQDIHNFLFLDAEANIHILEQNLRNVFKSHMNTMQQVGPEEIRISDALLSELRSLKNQQAWRLGKCITTASVMRQKNSVRVSIAEPRLTRESSQEVRSAAESLGRSSATDLEDNLQYIVDQMEEEIRAMKEMKKEIDAQQELISIQISLLGRPSGSFSSLT